MQFLTQQVNNIYANAAIEGLIQSLKHEITDFWEASKPEGARNDTTKIRISRVELLDPKIFERSNPVDFKHHHIQL